MEYRSARSPGRFNRRRNIIDFEHKKHERRAGKLQRLLFIGLVSATFGASVPLAAHKLQSLPFLQDIAAPAPVSVASLRRGIVICQGGDRKARKVTCLVDGDTGWERGVKWRLDGIDTPELSSPGCRNEHRKAIQARDRLQQLMNAGYEVRWTGSSGSYGRKLARIRLSDGRFAGDVLLAEGLAQPWPNSGNIWCMP